MNSSSLILEGVQSLDWQLMRKKLPSMSARMRSLALTRISLKTADLTADQKNSLFPH